MTHDVAPDARLFAEIVEVAPDRSATDALRLGEKHWSEIRSRVDSPYDAESCRLIALAAGSSGEHQLAAIWRARALMRFAQLGWIDGVAAVQVGETFARLARDNGGYPDGQTLDRIRPSKVAFEILSTLAPLTEQSRSIDPRFRLSQWSPDPDLTVRFYWEKRGFLLLLDRLFVAARDSYDQAATVARPGRGAAKVRAGALLVDYLRARANTAPQEDGARVVAEQRAVIADLEAVGDPTLVRIARHNLDAMLRDAEDLAPYEYL